MVYYYNFWNFYLIFILFILLLLLLLPGYIKKDIVPPLSEANYIIQNPTGNFNILNSQATTFSDLIFEDGIEGGTCALDFGSSGGDTSTISYIPYYSESHKPLTGYFDLNIGTSLENTLAFRVVDKNISPGSTLSSYNYGWSTLKTTRIVLDSTPIYNVKVPFNIPGYNSQNHKLTVQASATNGSSFGLELSSAYLYYYPN